MIDALVQCEALPGLGSNCYEVGASLIVSLHEAAKYSAKFGCGVDLFERSEKLALFVLPYEGLFVLPYEGLFEPPYEMASTPFQLTGGKPFHGFSSTMEAL